MTDACRGKTVRELEESITKTAEIIERASGRSPRYFRPPEGKCTPELDSALASLGYDAVFWTVDSRDWTGKPAEAGFRQSRNRALVKREEAFCHYCTQSWPRFAAALA